MAKKLQIRDGKMTNPDSQYYQVWQVDELLQAKELELEVSRNINRTLECPDCGYTIDHKPGELEAENARLKEEKSETYKEGQEHMARIHLECGKIIVERDRLKIENSHLKEYTSHLPTCAKIYAIRVGKEEKCTCGLNKKTLSEEKPELVKRYPDPHPDKIGLLSSGVEVSSVVELIKAYKTLESQLKAKEEQVEKLKEYTVHHKSCVWNGAEGGPDCSCGLHDIESNNQEISN